MDHPRYRDIDPAVIEGLSRMSAALDVDDSALETRQRALRRALHGSPA